MREFHFEGSLPASKSVLNRLLVIGAFEPNLEIQGQSSCEDVEKMRTAVAALRDRSDSPLTIDCGSAGTVFRFGALLASRFPGKYHLTGSRRLIERPQQPLLRILDALGVDASLTSSGLRIDSRGWQRPRGALSIERSQSSQFATAVLLSAWDLPFELTLEWSSGTSEEDAISKGYWDLTRGLVSDLGMDMKKTPGGWAIAPGARVRAQAVKAELDLSSAFSIAALAAVAGRATIFDFPKVSLQPDAVFPQILERMGVSIGQGDHSLIVERGARLLPIDQNLADCPDLFPVLSVLCSFADGVSHLFGAPHLAHKESSRIESSAQLIRLLGRKVEVHSDGLTIEGRSPREEWADRPGPVFEFDPQQDHRLAMATGLTMAAGAPLRCSDPGAVDKSFPQFWDYFAQGWS